LTQRAAPSGEHGDAQAGVVAAVRPPFQRKPGGGGPGVCWIASEVEVLLSTSDVVRPDVLGWRRERCPERPTGTPVKVRPDWICEVVSQANATDDTVKKLRLYHRAAIPHYWLVDPRDATMTVMRWSEDGYITLLRAERGEIVRAEPFDAIEFAVGALFGDDPAGE
jgi:Uma2 family endonuclease